MLKRKLSACRREVYIAGFTPEKVGIVTKESLYPRQAQISAGPQLCSLTQPPVTPNHIPHVLRSRSKLLPSLQEIWFGRGWSQFGSGTKDTVFIS